jgi:uncharacterized membrane protein
MLADLHRRHAFVIKRWIGGALLGGGAFQLYDGTIQHKLMKIHQIRYNVDVTPYDVVWNGIAFGMIVAAYFLLKKTNKRSVDDHALN